MLPPLTTTPTLTWRSSYDNADCLQCPSPVPPPPSFLPQELHPSFLPFFHPCLPLLKPPSLHVAFLSLCCLCSCSCNVQEFEDWVDWLNDWNRGPHIQEQQQELRDEFNWLGAYIVVASFCRPQMRPTVRCEFYLWWGLNRHDPILYSQCNKALLFNFYSFCIFLIDSTSILNPFRAFVL